MRHVFRELSIDSVCSPRPLSPRTELRVRYNLNSSQTNVASRGYRETQAAVKCEPLAGHTNISVARMINGVQ